ncbi:MAG: hypothetical protein BGO26_08195 [Actinobacteria bacterium 69-20]|nr:DUF952 domain-containing protein [Actinomycetota bacterium]OJV30407.1 MAG: hypothetical protein BGO26_08195 [Actinobacteria bacterium 69-20]
MTAGPPFEAEPIYHIALQSDWESAQARGEYRISTRGRTLADEGFIHCSHPGQVGGVFNAFYADVTEPVVLLSIDPSLLDVPVVDEMAMPGSAPGSSGAELFPHVYGPLPVAAVIAVHPYP